MVASKIMVAYDGSDLSRKALDWALTVQARKGSEIEVISVSPPLSTFHLYEGTAPQLSELHEIQKTAMKQELEQLVKETADKGRTITAQLLEGDITETLLSHSEKSGADLIVSGTRGRGGFTGLFLGSIAQRLATYAKIPVVIVK